MFLLWKEKTHSLILPNRYIPVEIKNKQVQVVVDLHTIGHISEPLLNITLDMQLNVSLKISQKCPKHTEVKIVFRNHSNISNIFLQSKNCAFYLL